MLTLLLSDVIGDRLEAIASGPTAADPTSGLDALAILDKYGIAAPPNVYNLLSTQRAGEYLSNSRITNVVVGNNELAAQAAHRQAEQEGFHAKILRTDLQGEASLVGERLGERLRAATEQESRPFCLIVGGETTVTVRGDGKGGRNQELALAAVEPLAGIPDVMLVSLATDGDDGSTGAAGAVVTGQTEARARQAGLVAAAHLSRNNWYCLLRCPRRPPQAWLLRHERQRSHVPDRLLRQSGFPALFKLFRSSFLHLVVTAHA